jgi:phosphatidate phosphatase APP1
MTRVLFALFLLFCALPALAAEGKLVVISDINETLRSGGAPVEGMAAALQRLAAEGADFHYVSFSGKSEEPSLAAFMKENGFPQGAFHLRDESEPGTAFDTKSRAIRIIFTLNAGRPMTMIGDSGMYDPEIYGFASRQWPKRIRHIYIRNITGEKRIDTRFQKAFGDIPQSQWTLFDDPSAIK